MSTLKIISVEERKMGMEEEYEDEESEMCQKLIQLSFAKIVNSKRERGGAKLHKNLLILHLLQKARTEHRRSADDDDDEVNFELAQTQDEVDLDAELAAEEENSISQTPTLTFYEEIDVSDESASVTEVHFTYELTDLDMPKSERSDDVFLPIMTAPSESLSDSDGSDRSSSPSDSDTDSEDEQGVSPISFLVEPSYSQRRRRKRKHSNPSNLDPNHPWTANKKCCTEMDNAQLSGLISVFNSGLAMGCGVNAPTNDVLTDAPPASRSLSCPSFRELTCES